MDCKIVTQNIVDFIDGTLSLKEEALFNQHFSTCKNCKQTLDETKNLLLSFKKLPNEKPSYKVRDSFYKMLDEEKQLQNKIIPIKTTKKISWKTAFQIAASFLLLFTGYFIGNYNTQNAQKEIVKLQYETQKMKQNIMLAMIDNRSPSKRIKAVNYTQDLVKPNTKVLKALIDRLKYDTNSNVRMAATEALSKFSKEEIVRATLIEALTTEKNPSIQIEIIQILVKIQEKRALKPMQNLLTKPETPNYVKDQVNIGISHLI